MPKKVWDMVTGSTVESTSGSKIIGDYFGLHKPVNATAKPLENQKHGAEAQQHLERTSRQKLNEGEDFKGSIATRQVDHVTLHIGIHPVHGLSAYADRPTSHANGRIEVFLSGSATPVVLSRQEFFGQLLEEDPPEKAIDEFCQEHWHV